MPESMSRSQSSNDLHAQLMLAAERSDNFFPMQSSGSSNASLLASSSKLSSFRRKLVKRRPPSANSPDPMSLTSFHPMPGPPVADVRPRKKSNQPLPQETLETVMKNVDAIVSTGNSHHQNAPPAVIRSLPELAMARNKSSRPSTSPAMNNLDKSRGSIRDDPFSPPRTFQRTPNTRQFFDGNILPPDPFARPLPSRSKSHSDMREASHATPPPMPKMPLTAPMLKVPFEASPTAVFSDTSVPESRRRSSTVIAYYTPPSLNPDSRPAPDPHEKKVSASSPTADEALGRKSSSPRSARQVSNYKKLVVEDPGTRPAPPLYTPDYGFVKGMWQESMSPLESSHDFLAPRVTRSASEPGAPSPPTRPQRSVKRPTIPNDAPSASSSEPHLRTPSDLSIFPYTPFLDPAGVSPRAYKTARSFETKEQLRPAPSTPNLSRPRPRTAGDRQTPEEIERRAISKYRDLERGLFGDDATSAFVRSRQDSGNARVSELRKPSAQRSAMTPVFI